MNESWHTWTSHGTHERVMAHMNESWHTWTSHGTHERVMAHTNELCHTRTSHVMQIRDLRQRNTEFMPHIIASCEWVSHVTFLWVMARFWTSHVTQLRDLEATKQMMKQAKEVKGKSGRDLFNQLAALGTNSQMSYIQTCAHTHTYVYTYICIYIYMYICIYISIYICIYMYVFSYLCTYIFVCTYVHRYTYTCINIFAYIYIESGHVLFNQCVKLGTISWKSYMHAHMQTYIYMHT